MTPPAVPEAFVANWPAHPRVRAIVTTRYGGASVGRYASFNLATHCGDIPKHVAHNRSRLAEVYGAPSVCWLNQIHGAGVVDAGVEYPDAPTADASLCRSSTRACAILTADCLPVLVCDRAGTTVGAAHCGWRGLANGVLTALIRRMSARQGDLLAWLGPAIGPGHYEIGADVRDAFLAVFPTPAVDAALHPSTSPGRWQANLYELARAELNSLGVSDVYGGGFCTFREARFYSYRRDGITGRMAAVIWLSDVCD